MGYIGIYDICSIHVVAFVTRSIVLVTAVKSCLRGDDIIQILCF